MDARAGAIIEIKLLPKELIIKYVQTTGIF